MTNPINPQVGETWETRDGKQIEILKTDGPDRNPIIGMEVKHGLPLGWYPDGRYLQGRAENARDLIRRVEPEREGIVWVNVDEDERIYGFKTFVEAEYGCAYRNRIARIRVPFKWRPWQFDKEEK